MSLKCNYCKRYHIFPSVLKNLSATTKFVQINQTKLHMGVPSARNTKVVKAILYPWSS